MNLTHRELLSTLGAFFFDPQAPADLTLKIGLVATNPGPTLFHCHMQLHMDFGFMAMLEYDG